MAALFPSKFISAERASLEPQLRRQMNKRNITLQIMFRDFVADSRSAILDVPRFGTWANSAPTDSRSIAARLQQLTESFLIMIHDRPTSASKFNRIIIIIII